MLAGISLIASSTFCCVCLFFSQWHLSDSALARTSCVNSAASDLWKLLADVEALTLSLADSNGVDGRSLMGMLTTTATAAALWLLAENVVYFRIEATCDAVVAWLVIVVDSFFTPWSIVLSCCYTVPKSQYNQLPASRPQLCSTPDAFVQSGSRTSPHRVLVIQRKQLEDAGWCLLVKWYVCKSHVQIRAVAS